MWLHYTTDELPNITKYERYKWQKSHAPNFSLTKLAYDPYLTRKREYLPYQKWSPNKV